MLHQQDIEQDKQFREDLPFVKQPKEEELPAKELTDYNTRIVFTKQLLKGLTVSLVIVLVFVLLSGYFSFGKVIVTHPIYLIIPASILGVILLMIFMVKDFVRTVPVNWITYILFTLSMAYVTAFLVDLVWSSEIGSILVGVEWMITITIVFLFVYTVATESEVSLSLGVIFAIAYTAAMFLVLWLFIKSNFVICGICAGLMGAFIYYVIWDLHCITQEKRYDLGPNDYLLGTIHVYFDFFVLPYLIFLVFQKCHYKTS